MFLGPCNGCRRQCTGLVEHEDGLRYCPQCNGRATPSTGCLLSGFVIVILSSLYVLVKHLLTR